jgi:hypothetical protein
MTGWSAWGPAVVPLAGFAWSARQARVRPAVPGPNRISWALWTAVPVIAWAAGKGQPVTLALGAGAGLVLAASLSRPGSWRPGPFDLACATAAVTAAGVWLAAGQHTAAVWLACAADGCAALPTIAQARPGGEDRVTYACTALGSGLALGLTWGRWSPAMSAFPLYAVAVCAVILARLTIPRRPAWAAIEAEAARW